jgi:outer membrane murein-binding lipoprotein Lpp
VLWLTISLTGEYEMFESIDESIKNYLSNNYLKKTIITKDDVSRIVCSYLGIALQSYDKKIQDKVIFDKMVVEPNQDKWNKLIEGIVTKINNRVDELLNDTEAIDKIAKTYAEAASNRINTALDELIKQYTTNNMTKLINESEEIKKLKLRLNMSDYDIKFTTDTYGRLHSEVIKK